MHEADARADSRLPRLVLASGSPRRRALLARLGLAFDVAIPAVDETPLPGEAATALARRLAGAKAEAALACRPESVILAADTVVSHEGRLLGKPADVGEARQMLEALRGRRHEVVTAVRLARAGHPPLEGAARTAVWMRFYADAEIAAYVATGDPFDKAGAYAIQHPGFRPVARLVGSYTNVVGLPLEVAAKLLRAAGFDPQPVAAREMPDGAVSDGFGAP